MRLLALDHPVILFYFSPITSLDILYYRRLAALVGAEKTLVQKSGYFARSAAANKFDQDLIGKCAAVGVQAAIDGISGCMGQDEDKEGFPIRPIEFSRIKGGKPFDTTQDWYKTLLNSL